MRLLALAIVSALSLPLAAKTNQAGIDLGNADKEVSACSDFYVHANGRWLKNNPVPGAYSSWGTFNELEDRNNARLLAIAKAAAGNGAVTPGSPEHQVGQFFASAMDLATIEKLGTTPIDADLAEIAQIEDAAGVMALVQRFHANGTPMLFGLGVRQDLKDNTRVIPYAMQGGLGLPNRDFYLRDDDASKKQIEAYLEHVAKMLELSGYQTDAARESAAAIAELERRFAQSHLPREEMRDPNKSYNIQTIVAASQATPNVDWRAYFDALTLTEVDEFSFSHPQFFAVMDAALKDTPIEVWRAYLTWQLSRSAAPFLTQAFVDENFRFYDQTLRGQKEQKPRDIRTIEQMNFLLGEPLGQLFVAKHFPAEAKARMMAMIENLKLALKDRLEQLEWMSADTKKQAIEKWATFTPKIGYPDKWRDYSGVALKADTYFANVRSLGAFEQQEELAKIGKPIDKTEWGMPPQQVNAYYNPLWNEIVFPAGILQPPFFDAEADDALNYGSIGAVIGHELLHGFDDSGSRFDAQGQLRMWWTDADRKEFDARAQKLVDQAGRFVAIGDMRLNGRVSLGENIADLGGLTVAYAALDRALEGKKGEEIDGLTPAQRFFFGWAQVWRRNWTDEALKMQVNTGPHAPGKFRVNGPLANMPEFKKAFSCKADDGMVQGPEERVAIW